MSLNALPEGELRSLPETIGAELTQLKDDIGAAVGSSDEKTRSALEAVKTAMEKKGATRKGVIDSIKAGLVHLEASDMSERLAAMQAKLETVRIGVVEPAIDATVRGGQVVAETATVVTAKGMELGSQAVEQIGKMPLVMKIPVISSIFGAGAFGLSWIRKRFGLNSPNLDRMAKFAFGAGVLGTAGVAAYEAYGKAKDGEKKPPYDEKPEAEAPGEKESKKPDVVPEPKKTDADAPAEDADKK